MSLAILVVLIPWALGGARAEDQFDHVFDGQIQTRRQFRPRRPFTPSEATSPVQQNFLCVALKTPCTGHGSSAAQGGSGWSRRAILG
eukprot:4964481-Prymnesium_polylepis.1